MVYVVHIMLCFSGLAFDLDYSKTCLNVYQGRRAYILDIRWRNLTPLLSHGPI